MKTYVFKVEIEQDNDGRWGAEIPLLPGCNAWGYTRADAMAILQEAAQEMVEVMLEYGNPISPEIEKSAIISESGVVVVTTGKFAKPFTYRINFDSKELISVEDCYGTPTNFTHPVTGNSSKLYVISDHGKPIYVGRTTRPIRDRLRDGFNPNGKHGYHGYAWRHNLCHATIDIWILEEPDEKFAETVEAEVVYLIRQEYGQWPEHQTEIHFHISEATHREMARIIVNHYRSR